MSKNRTIKFSSFYELEAYLLNYGQCHKINIHLLEAWSFTEHYVWTLSRIVKRVEYSYTLDTSYCIVNINKLHNITRKLKRKGVSK